MSGMREHLAAAEQAGVIDSGTRGRLLAFIEARAPGGASALPPQSFDLSHLLWYAGALIIIGAMGLFSTLAFAQMGGWALATTAVIYAVCFAIAGNHLWHKKDLVTPAGLLIACAVGMIPLAIYGIQEAFELWGASGKPGTPHGFYIWIKGGWVPMEIGTIIGACVALWFFPFPFITAIAALCLWFLTMDVTEFFLKNMDIDSYSWTLRQKVTMWFGLAIIPFAWFIDIKKRSGDFAFWLHLAGIAAFWGGMTSQYSDSELSKFIYFLINTGLVLFAVFMMRRAYAAFGAIGICLYLGHLANSVFKDSLLFPFALSLIGLALIGVGILYFRRRETIQAAFDAALPDWLKRLRPAHAR